jgi:SAM-dependent methyltransferase
MGEQVMKSAASLYQARATYAADIATGLGRFFESRRETCPWCGSSELKIRMVTRDHVQGKPGRFMLDECASCGHVFQNPRLSSAGLDYYYRDVYDGYGAKLSQAFSLQALVYMLTWRLNRGRCALAASAGCRPRAWLDVGAGYGHLCAKAREYFPDAVFDGLDTSGGVEDALRRGWVRRAFRGQFVDLSEKLSGSYDVVSMIHYLEHTHDPFAEIEAARRVLAPAGLLLIEVPNPDCRLSRVLGEWWSGWLAPQHLHMIPPRNLLSALRDRGFELVRVEMGAANMPNDLTVAAIQVANSLAPDPRPPWRSAEHIRSRLWRRRAVMTVASPLALLALLTDHLLHMGTRHGNGGNAYRVLARKTQMK